MGIFGLTGQMLHGTGYQGMSNHNWCVITFYNLAFNNTVNNRLYMSTTPNTVVVNFAGFLADIVFTPTSAGNSYITVSTIQNVTMNVVMLTTAPPQSSPPSFTDVSVYPTSAAPGLITSCEVDGAEIGHMQQDTASLICTPVSPFTIASSPDAMVGLEAIIVMSFVL